MELKFSTLVGDWQPNLVRVSGRDTLYVHPSFKDAAEGAKLGANDVAHRRFNAQEIKVLKSQSKRLVKEAKRQGKELTHSAALDQTAIKNGFRNWSMLQKSSLGQGVYSAPSESLSPQNGTNKLGETFFVFFEYGKQPNTDFKNDFCQHFQSMDIGWRDESIKVFGIEFTQGKCYVFLDPNQEFCLRSKTRLTGTSVIGALQILLKFVHHFLNERSASITAIGYAHHQMEKLPAWIGGEMLSRNEKRITFSA